MNVLEKIKMLIESNDWYDPSNKYSDMLMKVVLDLSGYPKVEINGDTNEDIKFVISENYNEEKYELLELENFEIVSADVDEVILCAGGDSQAPLTFSIKENRSNGHLVITDIYPSYNDGMSLDEFDELVRNI